MLAKTSDAHKRISSRGSASMGTNSGTSAFVTGPNLPTTSRTDSSPAPVVTLLDADTGGVGSSACGASMGDAQQYDAQWQYKTFHVSWLLG